jgi:hypothetical protein
MTRVGDGDGGVVTMMVTADDGDGATMVRT